MGTYRANVPEFRYLKSEFFNLKYEKEAPELFCPNGCKIEKILKVNAEGNNVETISRPHILHEVLIEVTVMVNAAIYFITGRKNKKPSLFFSSRKLNINSIHHEICQLLSIRIQYDKKDPPIIYRMTLIIQNTSINM